MVALVSLKIGKLMNSQNFYFLNSKLPELEVLGGFAEKYAHADPESCGVKLRLFAETFTKILYNHLSIDLPDEHSFYDLLNNDIFKEAVSPAILGKLHLLRKVGNKAAHGHKLNSTEAGFLLREAYDLGAWLYVSMFNGNINDIPGYREPVSPAKGTGLDKEKRLIREKINEQEKELEGLLAERERLREESGKKRKSRAERQQLFKKGKTVAEILHFDEEATRRLLIDEQLSMAGWKVGPGGESTDEVGQEVEVRYQPTKSGIGYADYVLWDSNGKPLAVIEAKKTARDAENGKTQADLYAKGLEKMHGQRPVIFYTNGYDIFMWNTLLEEPPRKVYGFYARDNLEYLHFQKKHRLPLNRSNIDSNIVDRNYQREAIKHVHELFESKRRKGLIVQATGTGKTRVAIALSKSLMEASWAKRILFLCDRRELRKQAKNVFDEFISSPAAIVTARTARDRDKRIYIGTYPAMLKVYQTFDVGFFDLIIADESHRSIYNVYGELFKYFDAYQIGLTATPVEFVTRNTFRLFECKEQDPTAYYSFEDAINDTPPWLVPFEVHTVTTRFIREGIRYVDMTPEQQQQLEEQEEDAEEIDYAASQVDKQVFARGTAKVILRNLMENGLKLADGSLGKTIIFARNHKHAVFLNRLFNELYPQYGGLFCEVIDNYNPRAEQLIDDFKGKGSNDRLTIAISVDMLDTGVDIPEILNLVFAKPVKSYAKFWQMIGRGTRLRPNLFGAGKHKTKFRIFDHWKNFEWFDLHYKPATPSVTKSLMQRLFESRLELANLSQQKYEKNIFEQIMELVYQDVADLAATESVDVREKWRTIQLVKDRDTLLQFEATTRVALKNEIAPLMMWRNILGHAPAYEFDLLMTCMQIAWLGESARFKDYKDELLDKVNRLPGTLAPVQARATLLKSINREEFWSSVTYDLLEDIRLRIRGLMKYLPLARKNPLFRVMDVDEDFTAINRGEYVPKNRALDMANYRKRVTEILTALFDQNETLQKIKKGEAVSEKEIDDLVALILIQDERIDLRILQTLFPETAGHLEKAIRRIIGLDPEYVSRLINRFIRKYPQLTAKQIKFLDMLKNHICRYGAIKPERLYGSPFTIIDSQGLDGVFGEEKSDLVDILKQF